MSAQDQIPVLVGDDVRRDVDAEVRRNDRQTLVLFRLEDQPYALLLTAVERVIHAVAVTPVPEAPAHVLGLINMAGHLLPVVSLRRCLGLPDRTIRPEDQFVIARTSRFTLALMVDEVQGLSVVNATQTVAVEDALPEGECRAVLDAIDIYNHERPHTSLRMMTPASCYGRGRRKAA